MTRIAGHFWREVLAAGVSGQGWSINAETGAVDGDKPDGLQAVIDAHDPTPTLEMRKADKAAAIGVEGARRLNQIAAAYRAEERQTWPQQATEADAYGANGSLPANSLLVGMATRRGLSLAEMVGRVNAARDAFNALAGPVLGAQQALETAVWAAEDNTALDAIDPTDPANWPAE